MSTIDQVAIWGYQATGAAVVGIFAVWMLWKLTQHLFAFFGVWVRMIMWWMYRSRCTCEASDPVKRGWEPKFTVKRLLSKGDGWF